MRTLHAARVGEGGEEGRESVRLAVILTGQLEGREDGERKMTMDETKGDQREMEDREVEGSHQQGRQREEGER